MGETSEIKSYHHGDLRDAILERAAVVVGDEGIEALSLRAIARDLGVSHGAPNRHFKTKADLLAGLAAKAWYAAAAAVASENDEPSENPHVRLNAMGRGFLRWALDFPALFTALLHPDVSRYANTELQEAQQEFQQMIFDVVVETQQQGRYSESNSLLLSLYTNAVPYGLAALLRNRAEDIPADEAEREAFIAELIEFVVPIRKKQRGQFTY